MFRKQRVLVQGTITAALVCVLAVEPAFAAGDLGSLGQNIGDQLKAFGIAVLFPIGGIAAFAAFGRRQIGAFVAIMMATFGILSFFAGWLQPIMEGVGKGLGA